MQSLADGHDLEDLCSIACAGKDCSGGANCGGCVQDKLKLLSKVTFFCCYIVLESSECLEAKFQGM